MMKQRKTLLANKRMQLTEAAGAAAVVILSINALIMIGTLYPGQFGISIELPQAGYVTLGLIQLLIILFVVWASLRRSNRIAGPLFAIARDLQRLGAGDLNARVNLRLGDEFTREAEVINQSIELLRQQLESLQTQIDALSGDANQPDQKPSPLADASQPTNTHDPT